MDSIRTAKILIILPISLFVLALSQEDDYSDNFMWIRKCCPENHIWTHSGCVFYEAIKLEIPVYDKHYYIDESMKYYTDDSLKVDFVYYNVKCLEHGKDYFLFQPQFYPHESFFMQNDGLLWVPAFNRSFSISQFCLEYLEGFGITAGICVYGTEARSTVSDDRNLIGNVIVMGLSLPFLFLTFVVYALLPERNLYEKCLMSYVFALFWAYFIPFLCQIYLQYLELNLFTCRVIILVIYFCFLSTFFWMNAIAIDIWLTFSGTKGRSGNDKVRFCKYSIYAWGMPLLFVTIVGTVASIAPSTAWYSPFGEQYWFQGGITMLLYTHGPLGILLIINISLFASTAWKIIKTRKETAMLRERGNTTHNSENQATGRFKVYIKLMFAMGVNWALDFIHWIVEWQYENVDLLVLLTHICNGLLGIFIFFMFVFKRNIWNLLKKRCATVTRGTQPTQANSSASKQKERNTNV